MRRSRRESVVIRPPCVFTADIRGYSFAALRGFRLVAFAVRFVARAFVFLFGAFLAMSCPPWMAKRHQ
jgi:hypothetical protein